MEKPKFDIPEKKAPRLGRILIFLCSVAGVTHLLIDFGKDYKCIFSAVREAQMPAAARFVIETSELMAAYWWIIAAATLAITLIFFLLLKSGTIYTLLSVLVWLAGAGAYAVLWISSTAIDKSTGG